MLHGNSVQEHLQRQWIFDLLSSGNQFVDIPIRPDKLPLQEFSLAIRKVPEVEECHMIASGFDYLLKVRTADMRHYREVLGEKISSLPHVASTSTYVAMETIFEAAR